MQVQNVNDLVTDVTFKNLTIATCSNSYNPRLPFSRKCNSSEDLPYHPSFKRISVYHIHLEHLDRYQPCSLQHVKTSLIHFETKKQLCSLDSEA